MINILIQARCNSSRLPNKIFKYIKDKPVLEHIINRLKKCKNIDNIIVCTTVNIEDENTYEFCKQKGIICYRGSENNVLERFYQASLISNTKTIIRVNSDCPLIDPNIIDNMVKEYKEQDYKYLNMCNNNGNYFPDGFECEIFDFVVLKEAWENTKDLYDLGHVTPYIRKKYFKKHFDLVLKENYKNINFKKLHLSLDTIHDFDLINNIYNNLYKDLHIFTVDDILDYLNKNKELLVDKDDLSDIFNGKGQELYRIAKEIIPGGNQFLSKRPEMYLPDFWPSYYQKANGIEITSLDGIKYKDFSHMSVSSCILGYCDKDIDKEVIKSINRGNICSLNSPAEIELTQLLCKIHKWANMGRYCKTGGEATTIAIRISRSFTKNNKIAFCGYHGWHDWYLSANLKTDILGSGHLLPGLKTNGVPNCLENTLFPFNYNDYNNFLDIIENNNIGTVIMEPQRTYEPKDNFLEKIREKCTEKKIVLIFDEISSGFKINNGGIHLIHKVYPDIAIFSKSMSNGYPMAAILGKKNIMSIAEETFMSSHYWTDDIGFRAAIATIKKFEKYDVGNHINIIGNYYQKKLKELADSIEIKINISGIPAWSSFSFDYENSNEIKTIYTQEMLKRHIIASTLFCPSYSHKKKDIDFYLKNIKDVFIYLLKLIKSNKINDNLLGVSAHKGFKRLA